MELKILYQDANYVAIDKPSGLLVHRSSIDKHETVFALQLLHDQLKREVFPCHRLDRPTSGVLLFALNLDALRHAQAEFAAQRCDKTYKAVVRGWTKAEGKIDYALRSEELPNKVQEAVTDFQTLQQSIVDYPVGRYHQARLSLLQLAPHTGRKHQLRRHLAHIRHPILGDSRHGDGAQNKFLRKYCGARQLMLRAVELRFREITGMGSICIKAPDDPEFQRILEVLNLG